MIYCTITKFKKKLEFSQFTEKYLNTHKKIDNPLKMSKAKRRVP